MSNDQVQTLLRYNTSPHVLVLPGECDDPKCRCHNWWDEAKRNGFDVRSKGRQHYPLEVPQ